MELSCLFSGPYPGQKDPRGPKAQFPRPLILIKAASFYHTSLTSLPDWHTGANQPVDPTNLQTADSVEWAYSTYSIS